MRLSKEEDILRHTSILYYLTVKLPSLEVGVHKNLQFLVFLPYKLYIQNLVKIGLVGKNMLTDDDP